MLQKCSVSCPHLYAIYADFISLRICSGVTKGGEGRTISGRQITSGVLNHCGGHRKSQQYHKYFLQYSSFASVRIQIGTWGRQTCFFLRAPSNLVTPLRICVHETDVGIVKIWILQGIKITI